jgi:uncharacterized protein (TIGR02145 family)
LVFGFNAYSQDSFTDPRDGVSYVIVEIEGLNWFQNNLQFKTDSSCFFLMRALTSVKNTPTEK